MSLLSAISTLARSSFAGGLRLPCRGQGALTHGVFPISWVTRGGQPLPCLQDSLFLLVFLFFFGTSQLLKTLKAAAVHGEVGVLSPTAIF